MRAVRIHEFGGAEKLIVEDNIAIPEPAADEVVIKMHAAGVNFVDTYQRSGLYPLPLPATLGKEGAGVITKVGSSVDEFKVGDRVCFAQLQGSYAEYICGKASGVVHVPDQLDLKDAAASMLQAMTAHAFTHDTYPIREHDRVLIHAGAGGTGALLIQMAKARGARVLTTVSSEAKAVIAREAGADEVIIYTQVDFQQEVMRLTDGKGVHVVYDSVGKDTYAKSMKSLSPLGHLIFCGNASGPVPPIDPLDLMRAGSLSMTRPSMVHYIATREAFVKRAQAVFDMMVQGKLKIRIGGEFALADAAKAQETLCGRGSTGKLILLCEQQ